MDNQKLLEEIKELNILKAEFINICNREMQYHIDRSFHYYMSDEFDKSDEELVRIFHLVKEARERLKKISEFLK